jgi:hypothetical protein
MLVWVRDEMLDDELISPADYDSLVTTDEVARVVEVVVSRYDKRVAEGSA